MSQATADTQASFDNAQTQNNRILARGGVSTARSQALQNQLDQAKAVALATARTKARQLGLTEQGNALKELLGMGQSFQKQGADTQQQGAGVMKTAADTEAMGGELHAKAADIARTFSAGFANLVGANSSLTNSVISANNSLVAAQQAAASGYLQMAEDYGGVAAHLQGLALTGYMETVTKDKVNWISAGGGSGHFTNTMKS